MRNFALGVVECQASGPSSVNHQQRVPAVLRIVRGKLGGDLGIAVAEEAVVGIDDHEAVFDLVHHRIGAAGRDDDVFDAVAVQVSDQRVDPDEGASRSELFLDKGIVNRGPGWRRY